ERGEAAAVDVAVLDVGDRRRAAALEQDERALDVLDLEDEGAHAVRMLLEPAPRAAALAHRRAHEHVDRAGLEHDRGLAGPLVERGVADADLLEVEELRVEAAAALEIVDVVVDRFDA